MYIYKHMKRREETKKDRTEEKEERKAIRKESFSGTVSCKALQG